MYRPVLLCFLVLFSLSACAIVDTVFGSSKSKVPIEVKEVNPQPAVQVRKAQVERDLAMQNALRGALMQTKARIVTLENEVERLSQQQQQPAPQEQHESLVSGANVDVYERNIHQDTSQQIVNALRQQGISPEYPRLSKTMGMAASTTVFYYDASYIHVAGLVAQELAGILKTGVTIKKGASPFEKNKIIVQVTGR